MKKCPECGCEVFRASFETHDTVDYSVSIDDDYSMDTIDFLKDYCGDSFLDEDQDVECFECGKVVYSNGKWEV